MTAMPSHHTPQQPPQDSTPTTLALFVRSLSPRGHREQQDAVFRRLDQLESDGVVSETTVQVWGAHLSPSIAERTETGREICDRIDCFRDWATANNMSLGSFFSADPVRSDLVDEEYARVQLPSMTLAEYDDAGEVQFVAPCTDGDTLYTVMDRLDALAARDTLRRDSRLQQSAVDSGGG